MNVLKGYLNFNTANYSLFLVCGFEKCFLFRRISLDTKTNFFITKMWILTGISGLHFSNWQMFILKSSTSTEWTYYFFLSVLIHVNEMEILDNQTIKWNMCIQNWSNESFFKLKWSRLLCRTYFTSMWKEKKSYENLKVRKLIYKWTEIISPNLYSMCIFFCFSLNWFCLITFLLWLLRE